MRKHIPLDLVIHLHLFNSPTSKESNSPLSTSSSSTLLWFFFPNRPNSLHLNLHFLMASSMDTSLLSHDLNMPWKGIAILWSQLEIELLNDESFEFWDRERDERLRLELLLCMLKGYTLWRCLDKELFSWSLLSMSFRLGLLSRTFVVVFGVGIIDWSSVWECFLLMSLLFCLLYLYGWRFRKHKHALVGVKWISWWTNDSSSTSYSFIMHLKVLT